MSIFRRDFSCATAHAAHIARQLQARAQCALAYALGKSGKHPHVAQRGHVIS